MSKTTHKEPTPKKPSAKKIAVTTPKKTTIAPKSPELPGYFRFSKQVFLLLRSHRNVFGRLLLVGWIASLLIIGVTLQSEYNDLAASTEIYSSDITTGFNQPLLETAVVFMLVTSGTLTATLAESQQIFLGIFYVFLWLTTVWLLRQLMAGSDVRVRDGLYSAGAPLLTTLAVVGIAVVQLLPLAIVTALLSAAVTSGVLSGFYGISLMIAVVIASSVATLYWLTTTFFAAIVATIPGTYPLPALRSAHQLITGFRLQVLLRVLWLGLLTIVALMLSIVPVILIDRVIGVTDSFLVPLSLQLVTIGLFIYGAAYIYSLYRTIIDERG